MVDHPVVGVEHAPPDYGGYVVGNRPGYDQQDPVEPLHLEQGILQQERQPQADGQVDEDVGGGPEDGNEQLVVEAEGIRDGILPRGEDVGVILRADVKVFALVVAKESQPQAHQEGDEDQHDDRQHGRSDVAVGALFLPGFLEPPLEAPVEDRHHYQEHQQAAPRPPRQRAPKLPPARAGGLERAPLAELVDAVPGPLLGLGQRLLGRGPAGYGVDQGVIHRNPDHAHLRAVAHGHRVLQLLPEDPQHRVALGLGIFVQGQVGHRLKALLHAHPGGRVTGQRLHDRKSLLGIPGLGREHEGFGSHEGPGAHSALADLGKQRHPVVHPRFDLPAEPGPVDDHGRPAGVEQRGDLDAGDVLGRQLELVHQAGGEAQRVGVLLRVEHQILPGVEQAALEPEQPAGVEIQIGVLVYQAVDRLALGVPPAGQTPGQGDHLPGVRRRPVDQGAVVKQGRALEGSREPEELAAVNQGIDGLLEEALEQLLAHVPVQGRDVARVGPAADAVVGGDEDVRPVPAGNGGGQLVQVGVVGNEGGLDLDVGVRGVEIRDGLFQRLALARPVGVPQLHRNLRGSGRRKEQHGHQTWEQSLHCY